MDILLVLISVILIIAGIVGSILPVLPGAPLAWLGLLTFYFSSAPINYWLLGITLAITVIIMILQYTIPAYGTKRYGGSKWGMIGTIVGLIAGIFIPIPLGILIGAFAGAFMGEMLNKNNSEVALRAAYGSFLGFLASTFIELITTVSFLGIFIYKVYQHQEILF